MTSERRATIERLYHAALNRPVSERGDFLVTACGDDDGLRREVESLLAHDGQAEFLSTPAVPTSEVWESLVGQRLGPYAIAARIGEGGMGEVYRGHDGKLGRDVAIKVLPRLFTADPARLARFEREARLLAALNHPHVGAIYGLEDMDGTPALILELVEGDTLAERIDKGPLPLAEVLAIAAQMADALDAAHERGIVHRDLKPANIKITPAGVVKVLDFGLAKAAAGDDIGRDLTHTPTMSATGEGTILGTASYMSPEQARGQTVDKRADIWAFGCVVYEMLTGRVAFPGGTLSDTIAGILEHEPDWTALPATTPAKVRRLLQRCLEKDARRRMRDIGDARSEIADALSGDATAESVGAAEADLTRVRPPPAAARRWSNRLAWVVTATVVTGTAAGWVVSLVRRPLVSESVLQLQIEPPPGGQFTTRSNDVALSPDGRVAAYVASVNGKAALWVRPLDGTAARQIPGTDGAGNPFWSPDGKTVGFVKSGKLLRVDLGGGAPVTICDLTSSAIVFGAAWSSDGRILLGQFSRPVFQVPASGGDLSPLTTLDASLGEIVHAWPQILPGGHFLYWTGSTQPEHANAVYVASLARPEERVRLLTSKTNALYAQSDEGRGYLLWWRDGTLVAQPFDAVTLKLSGEPLPIADSIGVQIASARMNVAVSANGTLVYRSASDLSRLAWFDRTGRVLGTVGDPAIYWLGSRISPDGRQIAATRVDAGRDLWLYEVDRGVSHRFTLDGGGGFFPLWSIDGRTILFQGGGNGLFRTDASGAGTKHRLTQFTEYSLNDWSRDGHFVLLQRGASDTKWDLWSLPVTPEGNLEPNAQPKPYVRTPFNETNSRFSPDGRWVAYQSDKTGRSEVYISAFPEPRGEWRISTDGGGHPRWGAGGHELLYRTSPPGNKLMAVSLTLGAEKVESSLPRELFSFPWNDPYDFDVTADGQRILSTITADQRPPSLAVIVNWPALMKKP